MTENFELQLRADIERLEQEANFLAHALMIVIAQRGGKYRPGCVGQDAIDFARDIARKGVSGELMSMTLVQDDDQISN